MEQQIRFGHQSVIKQAELRLTSAGAEAGAILVGTWLSH
jgi:hypothetical protein